MRIRLRRRQFGQFVLVSTLTAGLWNWVKKQRSQANPNPFNARKPMLNTNTIDITLRVNGTSQALQLDPRVTLLDALRESLALTGTKKGCDHGACGACTVLVEGRRINACLTLAAMNGGKEITTIEGLAKGEDLNPLQAAFIKHDAFQCGYCTPGQICSAVALLAEGHSQSETEIREWMSGNLCRCGAYPNIVSAIQEVVQGGSNASV